MENERAHAIYDTVMAELRPYIGDQATSNVELDRVGRILFNTRYKGTFPFDLVGPLSRRQPYAIVNLDDKKSPGSHWVAAARDKDRVIIYDSFGRSNKKILPYRRMFGRNVHVIDTDRDSEQKLDEENCGLRAMAWLFVLDKWGADLAMRI